MSKSELEPPPELLEKVMAVADVKGQLSAEERRELDGWDVCCHVKTLPGGSLLYQVSGKITARLRFAVDKDGSITVQKYKPGDWEHDLEPTYARARYWMENLGVSDEMDGLLAIDERLADTEAIEERIRRFEKRLGEKPNDATSWVMLRPLYLYSGRFKEAERACINMTRAWPGVAFLHYQLVWMYMIALFNAKHLKLLPSLTEYIGLTPQALDYSYEQTRHLAEQHIREAFKLMSPKDSELRNALEKHLSELKYVDKASLEEKPEAELLIILNNFQEQPEELAKRLEEMVDERPDFALAWSHLSMAYVRCGRPKDAERVAMKAVELAPDNGPCHFNLSTLFYMALCNRKRYDWDSIERLKDMIGQERVHQLRLIDRHIFPEEEPPRWMQGITLEALGCSYKHARQMVEEHAREAIRLSTDPEFREEAKSQLATLRMMDEITHNTDT